MPERPSAPRLIQRALLRGSALLASLGLGRELPPAPQNPPPRESPPVVQVEPCKEDPPTDLLVDLASSGEGDREALPPLWVQTSPKIPRLGEARLSKPQKWGKWHLMLGRPLLHGAGHCEHNREKPRGKKMPPWERFRGGQNRSQPSLNFLNSRRSHRQS